jgi:hypothetical protein
VNKKIEELIKLYSMAQENIINTISYKETKGNSTKFLEGILVEIKAELIKLQLVSNNLSIEMIQYAYRLAWEETIVELGLNPNDMTFSSLNKGAIEVLNDNMINSLSEVNKAVGRQIEDIIRDIGVSSSATKYATGQTVKELKKELVKNLIDNGIGGIKDKRGRTISLSAYASLVARSTTSEAQNTAVINTVEEHGEGLVKMTSHNSPCPICAAYEGRVYSIDGKDKRFPHINNVPGFKAGYNNIHPNCRHRISGYVASFNDVDKDMKESNRAFTVPKDKEREIEAYHKEQKQKAQLRNDRKQYDRYKLALGSDAPKSFQGFLKSKRSNSDNWKELQSKYKSIRRV